MIFPCFNIIFYIALAHEAVGVDLVLKQDAEMRDKFHDGHLVSSTKFKLTVG